MLSDMTEGIYGEFKSNKNRMLAACSVEPGSGDVANGTRSKTTTVRNRIFLYISDL